MKKWLLLLLLSITVHLLPAQSDTLHKKSILVRYLNNLKNTKDKKRSFFISIFKPEAYNKDIELWGLPYADFDTGDPMVYYRRQAYLKYNYKFETGRGLYLGHSKSINLTKKLRLNHGIGINYFELFVSRSNDTLKIKNLIKYS